MSIQQIELIINGGHYAFHPRYEGATLSYALGKMDEVMILSPGQYDPRRMPMRLDKLLGAFKFEGQTLDQTGRDFFARVGFKAGPSLFWITDGPGQSTMLRACTPIAVDDNKHLEALVDLYQQTLYPGALVSAEIERINNTRSFVRVFGEPALDA